ncbi:MAG: hypothetical protein MUF85_01605 [Patescibacteria group bacterium]|jgi:hypothetical protein|nr:hypothetical protein [Patescibacteria group bacterium]
MSEPILVQDVKPVVVQDSKPISIKDDNDTDVPVIVKHQATSPVSNVQIQPGALDDVKEAINKSDTKSDLASKAATVNPTQEFKELINNESQANYDSQNVEPKLVQEQQLEHPPQVDKNTEAKDVPQKNKKELDDVQLDKSENFDAVDNLPSDIAKISTTVSDNSQQPKIYDTKEYHVPITAASHKHGGSVGTVIAGALSAIAVVVVIYFVAR